MGATPDPAHRGRHHRFPLCPHSRKVRYREHNDVTQALIACRRMAALAQADGLPTRRREVRSYRCGACRGWHLTSRRAPAMSAGDDEERG